MDKTIVIIGFVQSLFGIIIFVFKRPRHLSFSFLAIWLTVIAVFLGALLLPFEVVDYFKPGIFPVLFLFGPLLFLYVSSLTNENFSLQSKLILHVLPLLLVGIHRSFVHVVPILSSSSLAENPFYIYNKIYNSLLIVSVIFYWFFSLSQIVKHRKNIPFYFSNYSAKNTLNWLIFVLTLFLVFFIVDFSILFIHKVLNFNIQLYSILPISLTVFTFIMIFFGINQTVIYSSKDSPVSFSETNESQNGSKIKYSKSGLEDEQIRQLSKDIEKYLRSKKPYLNPDFSLQMMVEDLDISRHKLLQVINSGGQKNFYRLINEFRINEVKAKLCTPGFEHYTLLGIALDCGFNSKTSFNRIFKEITGVTPSEYKNSL